jgi:hypothetical protein
MLINSRRSVAKTRDEAHCHGRDSFSPTRATEKEMPEEESPITPFRPCLAADRSLVTPVRICNRLRRGSRQGLRDAIDDTPRPVLVAFQKHQRLRQSRARSSSIRSNRSRAVSLCKCFTKHYHESSFSLPEASRRERENLKETPYWTAPRSPPRKLPRQKQLWGKAGIK